jgi:alkanesulfonate monooxygenase
MKLGTAISQFTRPDGPMGITPFLRATATAVEDAGFARLAVVDHVWQMPNAGAGEDMLEGYTLLGFLAACTTRVELLTLVTSAVYREPGLLVKIATTLDVLSQGRALLGIGVGAPFNGTEAAGLGIPYPGVSERFERLEEILRIAHQMWSASEEPFHSKHYRLGRTHNEPQPIRRPHPPILIAGSGEEKTLRLVARYGDACNLLPTPDIARKLEVLRRHCDEAGRDYSTIEKTSLLPFDLGHRGENVAQLLSILEHHASLGIEHVFIPMNTPDPAPWLEVMAQQVIPRTLEF